MKKLFALLLTGLLLLSACGNPSVGETDTANTDETVPSETTTPSPVLTPAKHEITVDDASSILAANELSVVNAKTHPYLAYHYGQQMRVVRTERGTYAAFLKYFNVNSGSNSQFYVTKTDHDGNTAILYYGEYPDSGGTVELNIGQDINGDIVVITGGEGLCAYIFDAETDELSVFDPGDYEFSSDSDEESYEFKPGYSQTMFDFANRKVYQFYTSNYRSGDYVLEWFVFDLETGEWSTSSLFQRFSIFGRVNYLFPFPDGKGGAYVVGRNGVPVATLAAEVGYEGDFFTTYAHDTMYLFHIPDLTSTDNVEYIPVHEPDRTGASEGIWSDVNNANSGGVFMDKDGYLHITYVFWLYDISAQSTGEVIEPQYRHAIFDGMECIYNEKIELPEYDLYQYTQYHQYEGSQKLLITQSSDGTLYMIVARQDIPSEILLYKADDALGKSWTFVNRRTIDGIYNVSTSIGAVRDGSIQDDIVSCFFYSYRTPEHPKHSAYEFTISLKDYTISEPKDILAEFDLQVDAPFRANAHGKSHQNKVVHTENGTYAVLSTEYEHPDTMSYSSWQDYETFQILKIENDKNAKILYTGTYSCSTDMAAQSMYMNIKQMPDGLIYVSLPSGFTVYVIDPATDEVTPRDIAPEWYFTSQSDFFTDIEGNTRMIVSGTPGFNRRGATLNTEEWKLDKIARYVSGIPFNTTSAVTPAGTYDSFYTFEDGNGGVYYVGTRYINSEDAPKAGLTYSGHTNIIHDSIALFHIPDITKNPNTYVDIQPPYAEQGNEGIWSVVNVESAGDVYLDSEGQLHIFYTYYLFDFDDSDRPGNAELMDKTFKRYHIIYKDGEVISTEELGIDLSRTAAVRMVETTDGTPYLLVCNIGEAGAKIDVYSETEEGWALSQTKELGEFTAESFSISAPRGGSVQDNVIDCIVYADDADVYFTSVIFE